MQDRNDPQLLAQMCALHMLEQDAASKALGIELISVAEGQTVVKMTITHDMLNGHKTCHGGMVFSLADTAFAVACNSQNQAAVAASCHIDFILPALKGDVLTATASQLHQGKRSGIYQVVLTNQAGDKVAIFKGNSARIKRNILPE